MQQHSTKFLRVRKFLLVLPILVIPFITLAFWALGGGKGSSAQAATVINQTGLNLSLPGANLKDDDAIDKLGYYERAASDSAKLHAQMKDDPYFSKAIPRNDSLPATVVDRRSNNPAPIGTTYTDPNEAKVYQKLSQLNTALNDASNTKQVAENVPPPGTEPAPTPDLRHLEQMMQTMNTTGVNPEDPEMKQLNGMLEKILDIQHPDRINDKLKEQSQQRPAEVFTVNTQISRTSVGLLDTLKKTAGHLSIVGFYGLNDEIVDVASQNAIEAVVHENQTLVNGATIKLRLLNDIYINGHLIAKDNFIYGEVSLNNERLEVAIHSIRDEQSLFPVKLEVFDMDGLPGIYIPGAITRDVAKQSTDNALQSVALSSMDPSIGAQAASAGIEAAKTLLSKKVKLIKVQVKAGYKLLLKDTK